MLDAPRWIRRVVNPLGFALFGIGAVFYIGVVFPIVRLATRDPAQREARFRDLIQQSFRLHLRAITALGAAKISFRGEDLAGVRGPMLVLANHPSLIDIVILASVIPRPDCVVKKAAWSNPFLGGIVRPAGYIPSDGGADLIERCVERIGQGRSLILFPEGTRSPRGGLRPFQRGAARIALQTGCPVMLVDIEVDPPFLLRDEPWYQVGDRTARYTLTAHEAKPAAVASGVAEAAAARRLTDEWRRGFEKRLGYV